MVLGVNKVIMEDDDKSPDFGTCTKSTDEGTCTFGFGVSVVRVLLSGNEPSSVIRRSQNTHRTPTKSGCFIYILSFNINKYNNTII
jgi:hypothetical protein